MSSNYDALSGGVNAWGLGGGGAVRRGGFGSGGALGTVPYLAPTAFSTASPSADAQCWFHEPRAVASGGKLWFGTNGSNDNTSATGRATLYEVNESSGAVTSKDLASGANWADDHNYPVVMIRPDGRLVVFYCAHRLALPINFRISVLPGTIAGGWSQEYQIALSASAPTYPSPVMLSGESNKVYLFFRDGTTAACSYVTSADLATVAPASVDGGALGATPTWSAETTLTVSGGSQGIYTKVHSNGVDRIDLLMTDAIADAAGQKNDIRHTFLTGGLWYTSAGVSLGAAASAIAFSSFTAVATSAAPDSFGDVWVWHIQRRSNGIIEALFVRFVSVTDHRYYYARWNGSAWSKVEIDAGNGPAGVPDSRSSQITDGYGVTQGYYSPGLYLDTAEEGTLYCSVGNSTYSVVYRYRTSDGGSSFSRSRVSSSVNENVRPFVPVGRTAKFSVLWASGAYHQFLFNAASTTDTGFTTRIFAASRNYATAANLAPSNLVAPTIAGTVAQSGNILTAAYGSWSGEMSMKFDYQWTKAGVDIGAATSATYTVLAGDVAAAIAVRVTATNGVGSASVTSANAALLPTNLIPHSEAFNLWALVSNVTVSTNVANDPVNAALVADRMVEVAGSNQHAITSISVNFISGVTYTLSGYAKYETAQFIQLLVGSAVVGGGNVNFDIQNGTVQTVGIGCTGAISVAASGWYRISMTFTASNTVAAAVGFFGITAGNSTRAQTYVGVGTNTRLLADAQLEVGSAPDVYVVTP